MPRPRYRPWPRRPRLGRHGQKTRQGRGLLLPALVGVGLALLVISRVDAALRPTLTALAQANVRNAITQIVNDAVQATLASEAVSYGDLVTVEKDEAGQVAVLAADTARLNALRTEILEDILRQVKTLDSRELGVPLGSLTGFATASDWGPRLPVRVLAAATPTVEFENRFTSAGINQTLHQIMLNAAVEVTLLIPGGRVETAVTAQVCAAETLLVGRVPEAYLELPGGA